jgi:hypothetical protein
MTETRSADDHRWLDAFLVITHQDGPNGFTAAVHPLGAALAYFGLGDTAEAARLSDLVMSERRTKA